VKRPGAAPLAGPADDPGPSPGRFTARFEELSGAPLRKGALPPPRWLSGGMRSRSSSSELIVKSTSEISRTLLSASILLFLHTGTEASVKDEQLLIMLTIPAFVGTTIPLVTQAQQNTVLLLKDEPPKYLTTWGWGPQIRFTIRTVPNK
jgi:hypothetical protein